MIVRLTEDPVNYRTTFISAVKNADVLIETFQIAKVAMKRQLTVNEEQVVKKQKPNCFEENEI